MRGYWTRTSCDIGWGSNNIMAISLYIVHTLTHTHNTLKLNWVRGCFISEDKIWHCTIIMISDFGPEGEKSLTTHNFEFFFFFLPTISQSVFPDKSIVSLSMCSSLACLNFKFPGWASNFDQFKKLGGLGSAGNIINYHKFLGQW